MTEMWYNLSKIQSNNVLELIQWTDSSLFNNLFGLAVLVVSFIIIFRSYVAYNNNPKVSFMYSTFFIAVLSVILKLLSLTGDFVVYMCWALAAVAIALQFMLD